MPGSFKPLATACAALAAATLALSCAPAARRATPEQIAAAAAQTPDYYPDEYRALIETSAEERGLLIYSNIAEYNWRPILEAFERRYPWIRVETLDMGPSEVFERYYSETSASRRTADLIVSGAPDAWQRFLSRDGAAAYDSPELARLPAWAQPLPGLYTMSTDPMIIIYNKSRIPEASWPTGLSDLVAMGRADPEQYAGKFTTYDATSHAFAYAVHWRALTDRATDVWSDYAALAPLTRPETGGANMLDKVTTGEYLAAYFTSAITVFPHLQGSRREEIVGWTLPADGTPLMPRGVAATAAASSPASARLLLDFLVSREGQLAASRGGMTPFRDDIDVSETPYLTYGEIVRRIGADNALLIEYRPELLSEYDAFSARWGALFQRREQESAR